MDIIRDIMDKQIVDRDDVRIGRVDGLVARMNPGEPLRIESMELGWVTVGKRLHPRIGRWMEALHRRFSVRRSARYHIPWSAVTKLEPGCVTVDLCGDDTPALDWEHWLRKHVVSKIPGGRPEGEEK